MDNKVDILIQGGIWNKTVGDMAHPFLTYNAALGYLSLSFVNKVIISTWDYEKENCSHHPVNDRIEYVFSIPPEHDGGGNLNYQIISSAEGLKKCTTDVVVKMRSDQDISPPSMEMLNIFYKEFHEDREIFVIGMGTKYPYHPQDHLFWGQKEDLINLFDLPYETAAATYGPDTDFNTNTLRGPIHLGVHYYARFSDLAKKHAANPKEYLLDAAPRRQEAMDEYARIRSVGFKPFPRVEMVWHKYRTKYMYEGYAEYGEVYHDDPWEDRYGNKWG